MLFWISWYQPTEDHRPLTFPPNKGVLSWHCTGSCAAGDTMCALVVGENQIHAEEIIRVDWPEAEEWRFCNRASSTTLSNRFPVSDWMQERIELYNANK